MDADTRQATESIPAAGYDFYDPGFVTWWLNSLYLFPLEDQLAIARLLRSAVHAALSRQEIDAFMACQACAMQDESWSVDEASPLSRPEELVHWRGRLAGAWRGRPWLTGLGVLAGAYFVGKGAWFLQQLMRG